MSHLDQDTLSPHRRDPHPPASSYSEITWDLRSTGRVRATAGIKRDEKNAGKRG